MKKVIAGGLFLISGVILYISVHIPAASLAATLSGWSSPPGKLGTALAEMGEPQQEMGLWFSCSSVRL